MLPEKFDRIEVGRRIKRLRQSQDVTVQELAKRSGVSSGYLSEVERGLSSISVDKLMQIAEGLESASMPCSVRPRWKQTRARSKSRRPVGRRRATEPHASSYTHYSQGTEIIDRTQIAI